MAQLIADRRDIDFVLYEQLDMESEILAEDRYQDMDRKVLDMIVSEARKLAINDAKSKARLTAGELGWTLGKPVKINYTGYYGSQPKGFGSRAGGHGGYNGPIAASANYVDMTVEVTFDYMVK